MRALSRERRPSTGILPSSRRRVALSTRREHLTLPNAAAISRGVRLTVSRASTSAPHSSRSLVHSPLSSLHAKCSGVNALSPRATTSAPASSRSLAQSTLPLSHAACSGVRKPRYPKGGASAQTSISARSVDADRSRTLAAVALAADLLAGSSSGLVCLHLGRRSFFCLADACLCACREACLAERHVVRVAVCRVEFRTAVRSRHGPGGRSWYERAGARTDWPVVRLERASGSLPVLGREPTAASERRRPPRWEGGRIRRLPRSYPEATPGYPDPTTTLPRSYRCSEGGVKPRPYRCSEGVLSPDPVPIPTNPNPISPPNPTPRLPRSRTPTLLPSPAPQPCPQQVYPRSCPRSRVPVRPLVPAIF